MAEPPEGPRAPGPLVDARARWRAGQLALACGGALALVSLLRPLRPELSPTLRMADAIALGLGVAFCAFLVSLRGHKRPERLAFYLFLVLCLDAVDQLLRPLGWPVWPALTVVIGCLAVVEPPGVALGAAGIALGLQAADVLVAELRGWPAVLATGLGWAALVPALRVARRWENERLQKALVEVERLRHGLEPVEGEVEAGPTLRWLKRVSDAGRVQLHRERGAELDELLALLARVARQAVKAHALLYFDVDRVGGEARLRAFDGPPAVDAGVACALGQDPFAFVLDRRVPFYATDFKRLLWELPYYRHKPKIGTLLALPVIVGEVVRGVLVADRVEIQSFTAEEPEVLEGFASLAAAAIGQARAAIGREETDAEFKAAYAVSNKLAEAHGAIGVRKLLFESARQLSRWDGAAFVMVDEERTRYKIEEALGWPRESELEGREVALVERTWAAWVLRGQGQSLVLDDLSEAQERMPLLALDEPGGVAQSLLAVPLKVGPGYGGPGPGAEEEAAPPDSLAGVPAAPVRLIGALMLTGARGAFDAPARRILELLANQAAATLHLLQLKERERRQAAQDGLTGLDNRRSFDDELRRACARQDRQGGHFALLLLDLDHFKKLNDTYGHPAGDAALRHTARVLMRSIRGADMAARYGGEEFVVVLSATAEAGASKAAEKIRRALEKEQIVFEGARIRLTASIGLAVWPEHGDSPEAMVAAADRALYAAKQGGRNRVVAAAAAASETETPASPSAS
ncbi:MAG: diguanylate cyclase [Vicinamibacteria bacterium]